MRLVGFDEVNSVLWDIDPKTGNWLGPIALTGGSVTLAGDVTGPNSATVISNSSANVRLVPTLPSDVTKYLDGTGAFSVPNANGVLASIRVATPETITSVTPTYSECATPESVTFTLAGSAKIIALYTAQTTSNTNTTAILSVINVDGTDVAATIQEVDAITANFQLTATCSYEATLGAGLHTIKIRHANGGASTVTWANRLLLVMASN